MPLEDSCICWPLRYWHAPLKISYYLFGMFSKWRNCFRWEYMVPTHTPVRYRGKRMPPTSPPDYTRKKKATGYDVSCPLICLSYITTFFYFYENNVLLLLFLNAFSDCYRIMHMTLCREDYCWERSGALKKNHKPWWHHRWMLLCMGLQLTLIVIGGTRPIP